VSDEALANLRSLGYIGSGESTSAPASARGSTRSPGSYNNEGLIQRARDRIPQAIEAFERAIALDPNLASAQWNLSDLLFARGTDLDRADALLLQSFAGGLPDANRFLIGRAIAYQRNGQTSRSLALMDGAVNVHPDDAEVWLFRGRYRMESTNCAGAAADFSRAADLAPANAAAHASLGVALMCQDDRAGAARAFQRSLQLAPNQPNIREFLARVGG
jgi:superkiller protein 3